MLPMTLFSFPMEPHVRKHGPKGYTDYTSFKPWLRDEFNFRCAYCLAREKWEKDGQAVFSIDHFIPQATDPSKECDYDNLFYVCLRCNSYKRDQKGILNPCKDYMGSHLRFVGDGTYDGTAKGLGHIYLLDLNAPKLVEARLRVMDAVRTVWESGDPVRVERWLGYPLDIPDLKSLQPRGGNDKPEGMEDCYFELKRLGRLPDHCL